jgi:hypothetical protein
VQLFGELLGQLGQAILPLRVEIENRHADQSTICDLVAPNDAILAL